MVHTAAQPSPAQLSPAAAVTCQIAAAHSGLISYLVIMVTAWPPPAYKLPLLISCSLQPPALDGDMRAIHLEHEI